MAIIPPTCYVDSTIIKKRLKGISYVDLSPLLEVAKSPAKHSILNSFKKSRWSERITLMKASMLNSLIYTDISSRLILRKIQSDIIDRRVESQMLASIIMKLTKKEYETKFIQKEYVGTMPYSKVRLLAHDCHYFNKLGLFPVLTIYKNLYLISSWKNTKHIESMMIRKYCND